MVPRRSSKNNLISGLLIFGLIVLIFFVPSYGWQIRQWLSPQLPTQQLSGVQADSTNTIAENQSLNAQLGELQVVQSELPVLSPGYVRAMVYSRYPLDFKNQLLVNAGSNASITVGAAAVFQGILIGEVQKVFPTYSIVQTVFDNGVKMPVRVGTVGIDGLLQGSSYPTVASINKTAPVSVGDIVYSAAPGLPYALPIGIIAATSTSADSLFQQATLNFSYDINTIQTILLSK